MGGVEVGLYLHALLAFLLDGCERLASCAGHFTPVEIISVTHWIEGLVGPTVGLDAVEKEKSLLLPRIEF
jgi:hypothetical protein